MLMFLKHFETRKYAIEILLENGKEEISFDDCFECNRSELLPKVFKTRDERTFSKIKLNKYENKLIRISCKGIVEYSDLKALLPTVFDIKKIKGLNEKQFIKENRNQLIEMSKDIIGKEQAEQMINLRSLNKDK